MRRTVLHAMAALAAFLLLPSCTGGGSAIGIQSGITYNGPATWAIDGSAGGPFQNGSMTVFLDNAGTQTLAWSATSVPSFVRLDRTQGSIQPQSRIAIDAFLDAAVAEGLSAGVYSELLSLHNDSGPQADIAIDCILSIQAQDPRTDLRPASHFASQGLAGGSFSPTAIAYGLSNSGGTLLGWRARSSEPWFTVDPVQGQLVPGGSAQIKVSVDPSATSSLDAGLHSAVVEILEASTSVVLQTRKANLLVLADAASGGWTLFPSSVDTRIVYVSSSTGDDANDGRSVATPKKTLAAGKGLLRNGFPDWLLLRCGDTWDEAFGEWALSGRSAQEPMLLSSYGDATARPSLRTGNASGLTTASAPAGVRDLSVVGIRFHCNTYDGVTSTKAVECLNGGANVLVEDCVCEGYNSGLVVTGIGPAVRQVDIRIRRNVVIDSWCSSGNTGNGIYASDCDGLLIEENLFDNNGWTSAHPHNGFPGHNVYIQNLCTNVTVRRNILASTDGLQQRSGGLCEDNLFLHNAIAIVFGGGGFPDIEANGVVGSVRRNVILDGADYDPLPGFERGVGMDIAGNIRESTVQYNIVAHNTGGSAPIQAVFSIANNGRGVENTVFSNNIFYGWGGSAQFQGPGGQTVAFQFLNNMFQNSVTTDPLIVHDHANSTSGMTSANNVFDAIASADAWMQQAGSNLSLSQWKLLVNDTTSVAQVVGFPDPGRTIATYQSAHGGSPTLQGFLAEARKQSKASWRPQYTASAVNDYVRAGFGL